jgi:hypothetical protein
MESPYPLKIPFSSRREGDFIGKRAKCPLKRLLGSIPPSL